MDPKEKVISPNVGDHVTSQTCRVFHEPVKEVNDMGFICAPSGQWEGTTPDWKIVQTAK